MLQKSKEEEKRNRLFMLVGAVIIVITLWIIGATFKISSNDIDSFTRCAMAGHPVMESYPRKCRTPDGRMFVEQVSQPIIK